MIHWVNILAMTDAGNIPDNNSLLRKSYGPSARAQRGFNKQRKKVPYWRVGALS